MAFNRPDIKLSVLIPTHNARRYLRDSLESIRGQTFRDFECIVIDDGSDDGTSDLLEDYTHVDNRIHVHHQEQRGVIASLNLGCGLARGRYIARMDADDISLPRRFERQVRFLDAHPDVGVCGTRAALIDPEGRLLWRPQPAGLSSAHIRWRLLFHNLLIHPSIILRRDILPMPQPFRAEAVYAEDYDLWVRLMFTTVIAELPEQLLLHRIHEQSVSVQYPRQQETVATEIARRGISRLLGRDIQVSTVMDLRQVIVSGQSLSSPYNVIEMRDLIRELLIAYNARFATNFEERRGVAQDAAGMLMRLARIHLLRWPGASLDAFVEAVRIDPFILMTFPCRILVRAFTRVCRMDR